MTFLNCQYFHQSSSISSLQLEDTSCWEKAHAVGAFLHPCNKESEKPDKPALSQICESK